MKKYVINLISPSFNYSNEYGYYSNTYIVAGDIFPVTDDRITERTKRYKSEKRAINSAVKLLEKCYYVQSYKIEET